MKFLFSATFFISASICFLGHPVLYYNILTIPYYYFFTNIIYKKYVYHKYSLRIHTVVINNYFGLVTTLWYNCNTFNRNYFNFANYSLIIGSWRPSLPHTIIYLLFFSDYWWPLDSSNLMHELRTKCFTALILTSLVCDWEFVRYV